MNCKKFRILEKKYSDGTSTFMPQKYYGDEFVKTCMVMNWHNDGWSNMSESFNSKRKALSRIKQYKNAKFELVAVMPAKNLVETVIHEVNI